MERKRARNDGNMWKRILQNSIRQKPVAVSADTCAHDYTIDDDSSVTCIDCGIILSSSALLSTTFQRRGVVVRRKASISTVYAQIPPLEFDDQVVNTAVTIYKMACVVRQFRSSFKRAIIAACVHRACFVCKRPRSLSSCAKIFRVKSTSEMEKAMAFVTENLPYGDFVIPINLVETDDLRPILVEFDLVRDLGTIERIVRVFRELYSRRSILAGCVRFFYEIYRPDDCPPLREFTRRYNSIDDFSVKRTTVITIRRRVCELRVCFFREILKRVFAAYLYERTRSSVVRADDESVVAENVDDADSLTLTACDGFSYPVDDVDDITEWNVFFSKTWMGTTLPLRVVDKLSRVGVEGLPIEKMRVELSRFLAKCG